MLAIYFCQENKLIRWKNTVLFEVGKSWSAPELHTAKRWHTAIRHYSMEWGGNRAITQSQTWSQRPTQHLNICLETAMTGPNTPEWLIYYFHASRLIEWMNHSNSFADKSSITVKHSSPFWTISSIQLLWVTSWRYHAETHGNQVITDGFQLLLLLNFILGAFTFCFHLTVNSEH